MNIIDFVSRFSTEDKCIEYIRDLRIKSGLVCDNDECGSTKHYWLGGIKKFQCAKCGSRTNIKAGTIMEKSKVPLQKWFMCIHLMTSTKKPISCLEMQRQLDIKKYETAQMLMMKIRENMGAREAKYKLSGEIEMDEGYFEVADSIETNSKKGQLKRGRGSQDKQTVLVMVESRSRDQVKHYKKDREMGFVKMLVIDKLDQETVNKYVEAHIKRESHIISDSYPGFSKITTVVDNHTASVVRPQEAMRKLPWVHTMISNCKRELLGVHHSVSRKYLQGYLDEFCYKVNRRDFETDLFDRLLISGITA